MTTSSTPSRAGFTLIDILVTIAVFSIIMAGALPSLINISESMKLGQGQREVASALQSARLLAVTSNRPIRVRFNCPAAGQYRITELIGSQSTPVADDTATDRCSDTKWKFPANDTNPTTRPNHDGPLLALPARVTFGAASTLEFWPDGSVHKQVGVENPWIQVPVAGTAITVVKGTIVKTITVNGLGKIQFVQ